MIPTLLILKVRECRDLILPVPLFLLWPLLAVAALGVGIAYAVAPPRARRGSFFMAARLAGLALLNLHGLKVDVTAHNGTGVYIWFI